jgi:hypothetical protein
MSNNEMKDKTYRRIVQMLKVCNGCQTHIAGTCDVRRLAGSTIKPSKYVPEGWDCPCSTCLVKCMCTKKVMVCPDLQNYYTVSFFCKNPLNGMNEKVFLNWLDLKFKRVDEYPPQIKSVVDYAFGYPK